MIMLNTKKRTLVVALHAAMMSQACFAQSSDEASSTSAQLDSNIEEIQVTGTYQSSITNALELKRTNNNIVDVVLAEDIGKFSDLTTAAALQRVPGVQVSRASGEARGVTVRGLPNIKTTIDGRSVFAPSGRNFAFENLPAEALAGLEVYKSRSADQVEGGIAGLINIRLRKPMDFDGFKLAGSARLVDNEYADETSPVLSGLISNRWDMGGGEFGALLNVSKVDDDFQQSNTFNAETLPSSNTPDGSTVGVPLSVGIVSDKGLRERFQSNLALQWRPNDRTEIYLDGMYADFETEFHTIFGIGFTAFEPLTDIQLSPDESLCSDIGTGTPACYVESATVNDAGFLAGTHAKQEESSTLQTALGAKLTPSDRLSIKSEVVYTETEREFENFIQDWWLDGGADIQFETNVNNHTNFDVVGNRQLDPANFRSGGLFEPWDDSEGTEVAWTLDTEYELDGGLIKTLEAGLRYADRDADFFAGDRQSFAGEGRPASDFAENFLVPVDLGGATYLDLEGFVAADFEYMLDNKAKIRQIYGRGPDRPESDPLRDFQANEESLAGYVQVQYESELFGLPVDGQFGTRIIDMDRTMVSFGEVNGERTQFTEKTNDTQVLPNISLNTHLKDDLVLRSSISKTISYPEFSDLNPNQFVFPPAPGTPTGTGSGGNPDLDPVESISYDLSLEHYLSGDGIASVSLFYRDIEGFVSIFSTMETIDGVDFNITRPFSSGDGYLGGVEVAYSKFFTELQAPFDAFGVQLNYTYIDGEVSLPDGEGNTFDTELQGVSKHNANAVFMYEPGKFFARAAYNFRDDHIESFTAPGIQEPSTSNVRSAGHVDATLGYRFNDHVSISLDGTNLTDEKFLSFWGNPNRPRDRRDPGRTFSLSLSFSM